MTIHEIKIGEIVRYTQKHKEYDWNTIDHIARVENVSEKSITLLLANGETQNIGVINEEKYAAPEISIASEFLFLDEINKSIKAKENTLNSAKEDLEKVLSFKETFINEMSLFSRLKAIFS